MSVRSAALSAILLAAALSGCGNYTAALDSEYFSSLPYDATPCRDLIAQRNGLVARYGDPARLPKEEQPGARPRYLGTGLGTVLPDLRPAEVKERRRAQGEIAAMDRSIERRQCGSTGTRRSVLG